MLVIYKYISVSCGSAQCLTLYVYCALEPAGPVSVCTGAMTRNTTLEALWANNPAAVIHVWVANLYE